MYLAPSQIINITTYTRLHFVQCARRTSSRALATAPAEWPWAVRVSLKKILRESDFFHQFYLFYYFILFPFNTLFGEFLRNAREHPAISPTRERTVRRARRILKQASRPLLVGSFGSCSMWNVHVRCGDDDVIGKGRGKYVRFVFVLFYDDRRP